MKRKGNIVRYTAEEIDAMLARGESKTDWARVKAMPQEEVERLADEEDGPLLPGWDKDVIVGLPPLKREVHIRLDGDVIDWFKQSGRGYQTRINKVLRAFVDNRRQQDGKPARKRKRVG